MANPRQIIALNVGSQRVSMGVFSKSNKDALILERYASRNIILDPSAEGLRLNKVGEAIGSLVEELGVQGSDVNYSVSGQSVFIRFVKLPALDDTDIEQLIQFEAQQHVPFPLNEVVWDYHLLPANGLEREAILVAIKADDLDTLDKEITSHKLSTGKVDCALTSLYNAFVDSYPEEKEPVMLIDIGAKSTDLIYSEQGRFFTRSIATGGIFITSSIARQLGLSFTQAEELKVTQGLVAMSNGQTLGLSPDIANLANIIREAMTRLASEIQRTTNHYRSHMKGNAPVRAYLCGGGAALPYTKEFLEDKLGLPVAFFNPMHQIGIGAGVNAEGLSREAFVLGGMVGTAINAVGRAALCIDLEPTAIAKQRENKKKLPPIIVGAVIAVLGAATYAGLGFMGVKKAEETKSTLAPVIAALKTEKSTLTAQQQELEQLDQTLAAYKSLTLQRFGYAEVIQHLLKTSAEDQYPYWFSDFEPYSGFNPGDKDKISGHTIIKESFTTDKGSSVLEEVASSNTGNTDGDDEIAKGPYSANAILLTGYVRSSLGGQQLIQKLQKKIDGNPDSLFTFQFGDTKLQDRQIMELGSGAKDDKGNTTSGIFVPFKLLLPLKTNLPVNFQQ